MFACLIWFIRFVWFGWFVFGRFACLSVWFDSLRFDVVCGLIVLIVDSFAFVSFYLMFGCLSLLRFGVCFVCCLLVSCLVVVFSLVGLSIEFEFWGGLVVIIVWFWVICVGILFSCAAGLLRVDECCSVVVCVVLVHLFARLSLLCGCCLD